MATLEVRPTLQTTPSDLADSLANISLEADDSAVDVGNATVTEGAVGHQERKQLPPLPADDADNEVDGSANAISATLSDIAATLDQIRAHFFVIQEKRHEGVFALADNTNGAVRKRPSVAELGLEASPTATPGKAASAADRAIAKTSNGSNVSARSEKNVALDLAMAQLNAYMETVSSKLALVDRQLRILDADDDASGMPSSSSRCSSVSSMSSLSSLSSFDDAFGMAMHSQKALKPAALHKRHGELLSEWTSIESEAKALEEELSADKYSAVFQSIGEQLAEMMDSLDKALVKCHEFVFAFQRDGSSGLDGEQAGALESVKRSFSVKRASYGPACEQMFASLERGINQRKTQNGSTLRRFSELKARWRSLRERIARMDKELKHVEAQIKGTLQAASPSMHVRARVSSEAQRYSLAHDAPSPSHRPYRSTSSDLSLRSVPKVPSSSGTPRRSQGQTSSLSPETRAQHLAKAEEALTRSPNSSSLLLQSTPSPARHLGARSRPVSEMLTPPRQAATLSPHDGSPSAGLRVMTSSKRLSHQPSRSSLIHAERRARTPSSPPVSFPSRFRNSSLVDQSPASVVSSRQGHSRGSEAMDVSDYDRPGSAAGIYYRPPSAASTRTDVSSSRIPRLSVGAKGPRSSIVDSRPGSSMSYASTQRRTMASEENRATSLRNSLQTPEPTIIARAQRASIFGPTAPTAKRSGRPVASRYSMSGYMSMDPSIGASEPPSAVKRHTQLWSNGRTTPLSAAALARVPDAQPTLDGFETPQRRSAGPRASMGSVASYRAQRAAVANDIAGNSSGISSSRPSIKSGRATPTFSDGGQSSVWGGTAYSGRMSRAGTSMGGSRFGAQLEPYQANPNDAIDVELGRVANDLGIHITRVDPPLPRGVRDLDPKSTKLVKYMVGDKTITVKLLQLHKPAPAQAPRGVVPAQQEKTKKLLTRVGGGWIDFESYLLSRMGTI